MALAIILYRFVLLFSVRIARRIKEWDDGVDTIHDRRVETITRLVKTTSVAVIGATAVIMILSELSIDIAPVLASVGVVGLAFGLGAQTLVQDVIAGFFLIVEGQYQIGDVVELKDRVGTVENLTLRTTHVRDVHGYLHIIPNGEIRLVTNRLRDWSRAIIDVAVAQEADLERALQTLDEIAQRSVSDDQI
ncbi:MAG: mechanosensitive ion channel, partial [Candidatus Promineifilaceae bacterium]|nr:mechanosensitive ion channel [Candidatus Promineifilaceae bacterium]